MEESQSVGKLETLLYGWWQSGSGLRAAFLLSYLAMKDITKKWTGRRMDWNKIYVQLAIFYAERNIFLVLYEFGIYT